MYLERVLEVATKRGWEMALPNFFFLLPKVCLMNRYGLKTVNKMLNFDLAEVFDLKCNRIERIERSKKKKNYVQIVTKFGSIEGDFLCRCTHIVCRWFSIFDIKKIWQRSKKKCRLLYKKARRRRRKRRASTIDVIALIAVLWLKPEILFPKSSYFHFMFSFGRIMSSASSLLSTVFSFSAQNWAVFQKSSRFLAVANQTNDTGCGESMKWNKKSEPFSWFARLLHVPPWLGKAKQKANKKKEKGCTNKKMK